MLTFYSNTHTGHAPQTEYLHGHKVPFFEMPRRVEHIRDSLTAAGLIDLQSVPRRATHAELARAHDRAMLDYVAEISGNLLETLRTDLGIYDMQDQVSGDEYYYESIFPPAGPGAGTNPARRPFYIFDSTSPIGAATWDAVVDSASLAIAGAHALLDGQTAVYALCRPPGHHAGPNFMGGYCYVNNAAVAAHALKARGRVAILDIDYHHGNGTQSILWDEPDMLFVSLHADPAVDYPYYAGFADEIGPTNTNVNLPLPHGTDETDYLAALSTGLARIKDFAPTALIVSLGFDPYHGDPMGHFKLEVDSFTRVGAAIAGLGLPTLYVQEGGYAIDQLGPMAVAFFREVQNAATSE